MHKINEIVSCFKLSPGKKINVYCLNSSNASRFRISAAHMFKGSHNTF